MSHSALLAFYLMMFSANNVRVLNGGLPKWLTEKRETIFKAKSTDSNYSIDTNTIDDYSYHVEKSHKGIMDLEEMQRAAYYTFNKVSQT